MAINIKDQNGRIVTGLRADIMRKSMENKNLLAHKGSIYVGTGDSERITVAGETVDIPITAELQPGAENTVLAVTDSSGTLGYVKINPNLVDTTTSSIYEINASSAINGTYAQYTTEQQTSGDLSKGTIGERLDRMEDFYTNFIRRKQGYCYLKFWSRSSGPTEHTGSGYDEPYTYEIVTNTCWSQASTYYVDVSVDISIDNGEDGDVILMARFTDGTEAKIATKWLSNMYSGDTDRWNQHIQYTGAWPLDPNMPN